MMQGFLCATLQNDTAARSCHSSRFLILTPQLSCSVPVMPRGVSEGANKFQEEKKGLKGREGTPREDGLRSGSLFRGY